MMNITTPPSLGFSQLNGNGPDLRSARISATPRQNFSRSDYFLSYFG